MEENTTSTQEQSVSQEQQTAKENNPTIIIQNSSKSNGIGTAGFVLALIAVFLGWVPVLGWIIWLLGLVLSGIGVTKTPKGLAIAGLVLSLIGLVILILLATVFATAARTLRSTPCPIRRVRRAVCRCRCCGKSGFRAW